MKSAETRAAYIKASVARLSDKDLLRDDPQEVALRLHHLRKLSAETGLWSAADRQALAVVVAPLLIYEPENKPTGGMFKSKPELLYGSPDRTADRVRELALDLAGKLNAPAFGLALSTNAGTLVRLNDCERLRTAWATQAPVTIAPSHTGVERLVKRQLDDSRNAACWQAWEAQAVRLSDVAQAWQSFSSQASSAAYAKGLQALTVRQLRLVLNSRTVSRAEVGELLRSLRARVQDSVAAELLYQYFPWDFTELSIERMHKAGVRPSDALLQQWLNAKSRAARWAELGQRTPEVATIQPGADRLVFNPVWLAPLSPPPSGTLAVSRELPAAQWQAYEDMPGADEGLWIRNLLTGQRWAALQKYLDDKALDTPSRWLGAWATAHAVDDPALLKRAVLALPAVSASDERAQGLFTLAARLQSQSTPSCPEELLTAVGLVLASATGSASEQLSSATILAKCLSAQPYGPKLKPTLAGMQRLPVGSPAWRSFAANLPASWLVSASADDALSLAAVEPALAMRLAELQALEPEQRAAVTQSLQSMLRSTNPEQMLPASRLLAGLTRAPAKVGP